jgi:hypothetical protein
MTLAVNYDSPGATATATNSIVIKQANDLATDGAGQGGKVTQTNDNYTIQIDLAVNIDSPNAVAIADSSNVTTQSNELTKVGELGTSIFNQSNSNHTIEFALALDINSPGAVAKAGNDAVVTQVNSIALLPKGTELMLADLGVPGFASGANDAGGSLAADQCHSNPGGFAALLSTDQLTDLIPVHSS